MPRRREPRLWPSQVYGMGMDLVVRDWESLLRYLLRLIDPSLIGCVSQLIQSSRLELANSLLRHTHRLAYLFQG